MVCPHLSIDFSETSLLRLHVHVQMNCCFFLLYSLLCVFLGRGTPWFHGIPHSNDKMSFPCGMGLGAHYNENPPIVLVWACSEALNLHLFVCVCLNDL